VDKLTALTASEFDDAYLAAMISGHKKDAKRSKPKLLRRKTWMKKVFG
jgi:hypothetical protein